MTAAVRELLERKKFLLAQKHWESEQEAQGNGDNFNQFMIREQLADVNYQLQMLGYRKAPKGKTRVTSGQDFVSDRQMYQNWLDDANNDEDAAEAGRSFMRKAVRESVEQLSDAQRVPFELWLQGYSITDIAERLWRNCSTITRNIQRAKANIRRYTEQSVSLDKAGVQKMYIDLGDPNAAGVVLSVLTPVQIAVLYLRYVEGMSYREMEELVGSDKTSLCRDTRRAVHNIEKLFARFPFSVCVDLDALDELAFNLYADMRNRDEPLPFENLPAVPVVRRSRESQEPQKKPPPMPEWDKSKLFFKPCDPVVDMQDRDEPQPVECPPSVPPEDYPESPPESKPQAKKPPPMPKWDKLKLFFKPRDPDKKFRLLNAIRERVSKYDVFRWVVGVFHALKDKLSNGKK